MRPKTLMANTACRRAAFWCLELAIGATPEENRAEYLPDAG
jgi:hypothetical protein